MQKKKNVNVNLCSWGHKVKFDLDLCKWIRPPPATPIQLLWPWSFIPRKKKYSLYRVQLEKFCFNQQQWLVAIKFTYMQPPPLNCEFLNEFLSFALSKRKNSISHRSKNDAGCVSSKMHNFCNNSWDIISNGIYFHNNSRHSFLKSAAEWKKYLHKITYITS